MVDLLLDDRRIWSFRIGDQTVAEAEDLTGLRRRVEWPRVLRPYLTGIGAFALRPLDGGPDVLRANRRFGDSDQQLRFDDRFGIGLIVNKFGRIGHALADYDPGMVQRLLDNLDTVREALAARTDLPVYVMSGTLLGPYRDGRIMPHDDDADLGYLSDHSHPADVVREAFVLGRHLRSAGLEAIRASAGHVQVHFTHEGKPDAYVDLFTGWIDDFGWWQHTFAIRLRARRDQVVPTVTIDVEGRPEPAPREPELMLEANYGPGWKIPDPSFRFDIPKDTSDRFYGYFSDYGMDRTVWEDFYRYDVLGDKVALGTAPSEYVRWLAEHIPDGAPVLELGSGRGHDALWLAERGHRVDAVDYVRWPAVRARQVAAQRRLPVEFRTLNMYELRRAVTLGAEFAARGEPLVVYGRGLLGSAWDVGRPTLLRLLSMLLRTGGTAHLDVPRVSLMPDPGQAVPLHRAVPVDALAAEFAPYGLRIDQTYDAEEILEHTPWDTDGRPIPTTRMVVSWQRRTR